MAERLMEARRAEARASRERPTQWRGPRAIEKGRGEEGGQGFELNAKGNGSRVGRCKEEGPRPIWRRRAEFKEEALGFNDSPKRRPRIE
jgi:hypothetical protein